MLLVSGPLWLRSLSYTSALLTIITGNFQRLSMMQIHLGQWLHRQAMRHLLDFLVAAQVHDLSQRKQLCSCWRQRPGAVGLPAGSGRQECCQAAHMHSRLAVLTSHPHLTDTPAGTMSYTMPRIHECKCNMAKPARQLYIAFHTNRCNTTSIKVMQCVMQSRNNMIQSVGEPCRPSERKQCVIYQQGCGQCLIGTAS